LTLAQPEPDRQQGARHGLVILGNMKTMAGFVFSSFQINRSSRGNSSIGAGRRSWSAGVREGGHRLHVAEDHDGHVLALLASGSGCAASMSGRCALWMDLLNSPRFTDKTSGISNNRFNVGPAPLVEIDHQIQQRKSASEEMDSDWILESSSSKAL